MTNEGLKKKYPIQDDTWPSRRWNKEMTDYVDLSGHEDYNILKNLKSREKILYKIIDDILPLAIRYAHGRHTYAPSMVRDAVNNFKKIFPDWELKEDKVIKSPDEGTINGFSLRSDYLDDLFSNDG